jgi:hypothetical protein
MTVVAVCSLKGSPGATTLACLLGAAWPATGTVVLVEADPAGGDCAARFGLSARVGWTSLSAAVRRGGADVALAPHLQHLPGGLPVLVGARGDERRPVSSIEGRMVCPQADDRQGDGPRSEDRETDSSARPDDDLVIVDLGRLAPDDPLADSWLDAADMTLLVVRGDTASAVTVRDRRSRLASACGDRIGLVVIGGPSQPGELERFTDVRALGALPIDGAAADVATGGSGVGRRVDRSPLWASVGRLAATVSSDIDVRRHPWTEASSVAGTPSAATVPPAAPDRTGTGSTRSPIRRLVDVGRRAAAYVSVVR